MIGPDGTNAHDQAKRRECRAGPNRTGPSGTDADDQPEPHRAKRHEYGAAEPDGTRPDGTNAHDQAKRHGIAALQ